MLDVFNPDVAPALAVPLGQLESACGRLSGIVQGLSQEALDFRGANGTQNSPAMLVSHVAYSTLGALYVLRGEPIPAELEAAYGPKRDENGKLPLVAGRTAEALLEPFGRVIDMMQEYLKSKGDDEASRVITIPGWPQPATVRFVLWGMATHSVHHQAQILALKAAWSQGRSAP